MLRKFALALAVPLFFAVTAVPAAHAIGCTAYPSAWSTSVPPAPGDADGGTAFGTLVSNVGNYHSGDSQFMWYSSIDSAWGTCSTDPNSGDQGYPEAAKSQSGAALSTYTTINSTFDFRWNDDGSGAPPSDSHEEVAYDLWWNGKVTDPDHTEVMIWVNNHGNTPAGTDTGTQVTDSKGHTYELWWVSNVNGSGSNIATFVKANNSTSGTIGVESLINYLASHSPYDNSPTGSTPGIGTNPTFNDSDFGMETGQTSSSDIVSWEDDTLTWNIS